MQEGHAQQPVGLALSDEAVMAFMQQEPAQNLQDLQDLQQQPGLAQHQQPGLAQQAQTPQLLPPQHQRMPDLTMEAAAAEAEMAAVGPDARSTSRLVQHHPLGSQLSEQLPAQSDQVRSTLVQQEPALLASSSMDWGADLDLLPLQGLQEPVSAPASLQEEQQEEELSSQLFSQLGLTRLSSVGQKLPQAAVDDMEIEIEDAELAKLFPELEVPGDLLTSAEPNLAGHAGQQNAAGG
jgi:hypothetical protein